MAVSESKTRIVITLTKEQKKELDEFSKKTGLSKSALVILALEEYKKGQKFA